MGAIRGKAPADTPALKPYWGKPAVRNFRGDDGNVGIMRSPVRAIVLPDRAVNQLKEIWSLESARELDFVSGNSFTGAENALFCIRARL